MKKVLFATTALVLSAGFAAADVSFSGYGRFGLAYNSGNDDGLSKTWMEQRLRLDIKASTTTDGGVEFGGKYRIQFDDGMPGATANQALFYFTYEGFHVEVGNVNTALDSDPLIYNSEIGLTDSSGGDPRTSYFAYNSKAATATQSGIYASYTIEGFTAQASYIDPDQYATGGTQESSLDLAYVTGPLTLAAGASWNASGVEDSNIWFVGGAYAFNDLFKAGLNYINEGKDAGYDLGKTLTVYGEYTSGPVEALVYVSNYQDVADELNYDKKTVYGIGAKYDLGGGTKLIGALHRNEADETTGEFGVKFKF